MQSNYFPLSLHLEDYQKPVCFSIFLACLAFYSTAAVLDGAIRSLAFLLVEFTYCSTNSFDLNTANWDFGLEHVRLGQVLANFVVLPIFLRWYYGACGSKLKAWLLWPFAFWTVELIQGYGMMLLFGHNPVWHYHQAVN
eukprot:Colp12_sorted_trinity150504_noHs@28156